MSKKIDVKKLANLAKATNATPLRHVKATRTPLGDKGVHGDEIPAKKAKGIRHAPLTSPKKKLSSKKSGIPFPATVAAEGVILA